MKKVLLTRLLVIFVIVLSTFAVGYYSGYSITGKITFVDLLSKTSTKASKIQTVKSPLIGSINPEKISGTRTFGYLKGKAITTGCNLLSVNQNTLSSISEYKNGFSICSNYGYDLCVLIVADKGGYSAFYDCTYDITCDSTCPPYNLVNQFGEVQQVNSVAVNCCNADTFILPPIEKIPQKVIEPVVLGVNKKTKAS